MKYDYCHKIDGHENSQIFREIKKRKGEGASTDFGEYYMTSSIFPTIMTIVVTQNMIAIEKYDFSFSQKTRQTEGTLDTNV